MNHPPDCDPLPATVDAVIVGGGIIGAAILEAVSRAGAKRALLLERERPAAGATAASIGIVRAFDFDPVWTKLAAEGLRRYMEIDASSAARLRRTGFLHLHSAEYTDRARRGVERLRRGGVGAEWLDPTSLGRRFPHLRTTGCGGAVLEPFAGYVDPVAVTDRWLRQARERGARWRRARVESLRLHETDAVEVTTDRGAIHAGAAFVAAGASTSALTASLGIGGDLRVKDIQVDEVHFPGRSAVLPGYVDPNGDRYARPNGAGRLWLGQRLDVYDHPPDEARRSDPNHSRSTRAAHAGLLPSLAGAACGESRRGCDAYTPDRRPWIGPIVDAGLFIAAGFSGGGVKVAPAVGAAAAAWYTQWSTSRTS